MTMSTQVDVGCTNRVLLFKNEQIYFYNYFFAFSDFEEVTDLIRVLMGVDFNANIHAIFRSDNDAKNDMNLTALRREKSINI